jgi:GxxExxY protein
MDAAHLKHAGITEKIIGCAMKVHSYFGAGFPEIVYKRAFVIEFNEAGLHYKSELEKDIYYCGECIGSRRLDLVIEECVLIELKALSEVNNYSFNQVINYLKVFDLEVGLLLNFGADKLQFKRFVNTKNNPRNPS